MSVEVGGSKTEFRRAYKTTLTHLKGFNLNYEIQ